MIVVSISKNKLLFFLEALLICIIFSFLSLHVQGQALANTSSTPNQTNLSVVFFSESGLRPGTNWTVYIHVNKTGQWLVNTSDSPVIEFHLPPAPPGSYTYSIPPVPGYFYVYPSWAHGVFGITMPGVVGGFSIDFYPNSEAYSWVLPSLAALAVLSALILVILRGFRASDSIPH